MGHITKAKTIAGTGIVSVVIGAVMVFAPAVAGAAPTPVLNPGGNDNPSCSSIGYDIEAKFDAQGVAGDTGQASGGGLIVNWTFEDDGTISFAVDGESAFDVSGAIVKQASADAGGGAYVYSYDPAVSSDTGLVDPRDDEQFSHITFCATTTTTTPTTAPSTVPTTEATTTTIEATTTTIEATTTTIEATTTTEPDVGGVSTTVAPSTTAAPATTAVVSPATAVAPTTTTAAGAVLGQTATRTLPATGSGSRSVAGIGVALMIFGAVLVGGSRRSFAGN